MTSELRARIADLEGLLRHAENEYRLERDATADAHRKQVGKLETRLEDLERKLERSKKHLGAVPRLVDGCRDGMEQVVKATERLRDESRDAEEAAKNLLVFCVKAFQPGFKTVADALNAFEDSVQDNLLLRPPPSA